MMLAFDFWAHHNRLRAVHPALKLAFAAVALGLVLTGGPAVALATILAAVVLVLAAGVPFCLLLRLLLLPFGFLLPGVLALVVTVGEAVTWGVQVAAWRVGVTDAGLNQAYVLGLRALAAVSCLYFLALTTPLPAVLGVLRRVGVPALPLEIAVLTYRYLFVLERVARGICLAQAARGGYRSWRGRLYSLGLLAGQLFLVTYHRAQNLYTALLARGYQDALLVPPREHQCSGAAVGGFAGLTALLVLVWLWGQ
ncbi:cobalt/nickel transport system permease protein [Thermodesulfitimonas autotrophica]|uniref:Cobalt/nickel transport system permease protein n=1 Tax=Thermodesulfitimonas autotrophica TaxID=1894989 RepID=A0A3N5AZD3_9THEO|nr:cobalt ECF transporter T component CbiQ [Thermodesulfitimonas autotrophica]RPF42538.1 cobalt/nickel transport system permease protein [Thermodesulfitimonas autotrophica]